MMNTYCIDNKDYTFCNALTWGNCAAHFRCASGSGKLENRIVHVLIGLVEAIPILGQIASLFELLLAPKEEQRVFKQITATKKFSYTRNPGVSEPSRTEVKLEPNRRMLVPKLRTLHRRIEQAYRGLPWPKQVKNIGVFSQIAAGFGDYRGAARAIDLIKRSRPELKIQWVIAPDLTKVDPKSFLRDSNGVLIHEYSVLTASQEKVDLVLSGPVTAGHCRGKYESFFNAPIGPLFQFGEISSGCRAFHPSSLERNQSAQVLHQSLFPSVFESGEEPTGGISMNLVEGSGIFLSDSLIQAERSQGFYGFEHLLSIQNIELRRAILQSMDSDDGRGIPSHDQFSFNFGYAHKIESWGNFVDCVAVHERDKHVVIVLNDKGAFTEPNALENIFTPERIAFLKEKGFDSILWQQVGGKKRFFSNQAEGRCLSVISSRSFARSDMGFMQLAAERMLATGDNSVAEAYSAKAKLLLYEVANSMKQNFLRDQAKLAGKFSNKLKTLLLEFGNRETSNFESLLKDDEISRATLNMCDHVVKNYSFDKALEGALKRCAWHSVMPNLADVEVKAIGKQFYEGLNGYLDDSSQSHKPDLTGFSNLEEAVQKAVL